MQRLSRLESPLGRALAAWPLTSGLRGLSAGAAAAGLKEAPPSLWQQYKTLSKLRLSLFVTGTAAAGYALGSDEHVRYGGLAWTSLGTLACAASANAFNQAIEVARDAAMLRTRGRPLPRGLMTRGHALAFACTAGLGGVSVLYTQCNPLAAGLGAANIALYAGVYTPLKVLWVGNTWVGAVVGAVPPLMGWASARGELDLRAGWLAACLYFWQLPHFLSLAWLCRKDYARGGYRMLSLRDGAGHRTAAAALRNTLYLVPTVAAAPLLGLAQPTFGYLGLAASAYLTHAAVLFRRSPCEAAARRLFRRSLLHLPLLLAALLACRVPQGEELGWDVAGVLGQLREGGGLQPSAWPAAAPPGRAAPPAQGACWSPPFPFLPVPRQAPRLAHPGLVAGWEERAAAQGCG